MKKKCYLFYSISILTFLLLVSCKRKVNEHELIQFINNPDNGLIQSVQSENVKISIAYLHIDLLIIKELAKESTQKDSLLQVKRKEYGLYNYFVLSLSSDNKDLLYKGSGNLSEFSEMLNILSFGLPEHVFMTTDNGDTLNLADYFTPNLYGMSKNTQVMIAFDKPDKNVNEVEIHINNLIPGIANQRFKFKRKNMEASPEINFN